MGISCLYLIKESESGRGQESKVESIRIDEKPSERMKDKLDREKEVKREREKKERERESDRMREKDSGRLTIRE